MGTWDDGLLDNDTALDGLGDLSDGVVQDILAVGGGTARVSAATGVLLQLSAHAFKADTQSGKDIALALKGHAASIEKLSPPAREILRAVMSGGGEALADRPASMPAETAGLLHTGSTKSPFGMREPSLFETPEGAAYVQEVAERCVESIDADFEDEGTWSDLCREGIGMAAIGVLLVLEPCTVPLSTIEHWRQCADAGVTALRDNEDEELAFHEGYYDKLDKLFAVLLARFG